MLFQHVVASGGVLLDLLHANLLLDDVPNGNEDDENDRNDDHRIRGAGLEDDVGHDQGRSAEGTDEARVEAQAGSRGKAGHSLSRPSSAVENRCHDYGADDERAEHVAAANGQDKADAERDDREVGKRKHAVTRQNHGKKNGDGGHEQRQRNDGLVTDDNGSVKANVELSAVEVLLAPLASRLGHGHKALDEDLGHAGDEHHDGRHVDAEGEDLARVIASERTDGAAEDESKHPRLTKEAEILADARHIDINLVEARDLVEEPVQGSRNDKGALRGHVRQRNSGDAKVVRHKGLRPVGELERDDRHDGNANQSVCGVAGHEEDQATTGKHAVVVPNIDVHRIRELKYHHHDVDGNNLKHDNGDKSVCPCSRRKSAPAHIEDIELNANGINHGLCSRTKLVLHELNDKVDAREANCNRNAGLEGLAQLQTKEQGEKRDDDRQHHVDSGVHDGAKHHHESIEECVHTSLPHFPFKLVTLRTYTGRQCLRCRILPT